MQANPSAVPCADDSSTRIATQSTGAAGTAEVSGASVSTTGILHDSPVDGDKGTADATGDETIIVSGATIIRARALSARA